AHTVALADRTQGIGQRRRVEVALRPGRLDYPLAGNLKGIGESHHEARRHQRRQHGGDLRPAKPLDGEQAFDRFTYALDARGFERRALLETQDCFSVVDRRMRSKAVDIPGERLKEKSAEPGSIAG